MPTKDPGLLLENQLCFALYATSRAMVQAYQPYLAPLGLTYPQYLVLLVLWEADDITVKQLGERLYLDSGTLTPMLKRMQTQDLITRTRDPEDERQVRVCLTPAGRKAKAEAAAMRQRLICDFGSLLGGGEALRNTLNGVLQRLQNHGENACA